MKESLRYFNNAKETLNKSPVEDNLYINDKYVKSACGIAYLGVLKAIEDYLLNKGLSKRELPKKIEEFRKALKKYGAVHNRKLLRQFDFIYNELYIAGYYRGMLHSTGAVKEIFKTARPFIKKISS